MRRPSKRSECINGPRPCPWVGCKYHLYVDVHPTSGRLIWVHSEEFEGHKRTPDIDSIFALVDQTFDEGHPTCALDLAEQGGMTLEDIGSTMHLTRERIRQIEAKALEKLKGRAKKELVPHLTGEED